jgi:hypothetical protein
MYRSTHYIKNKHLSLVTFQALSYDPSSIVFFDEILIYSSSWLEHVCLVFNKLQERKHFLKRSKCFIGAQSFAYLDHIISIDDVALDEQKVQAVQSWLVPISVRVVHMFLGLAGYLRCVIRDYSAIAATLTKLLCKEGFWWTTEAKDAF